MTEEEPEWRKKLKRIQAANKKQHWQKTGGRSSMNRSRDTPNRCDKCTRKIARYAKKHTHAGSTFCLQCAKDKGLI